MSTMSEMPAKRPTEYATLAAPSLSRIFVASSNSTGLGENLFHRRRREAILLGVLALVSAMRVSSRSQSPGAIYSEAALVFSLFVIAWLMDHYKKVSKRAAINHGRLARWVASSAMIVPLGSRLVIGAIGGTPAAWEIVMLTTLGVAAIALTFCSQSAKHSALSVVCSGFLMLFSTAISDRVDAVYVAVVWVLICLWWMLANHWERLEVHLAQSVHRHRGMRFGMLAIGVIICGLAAMASWGRGPASRLLQNGVMPTSGGNQWSDPSARSGVGNGDAVVAAKDHALSFGAVESDVFLQSHQPSLFDLFDDVLGKPERIKRSEKAISLANQARNEEKKKGVQSQSGGASFSIARQSPPQKQKQAERKTASMIHWVGPPATGLALQRYDRFDGLQWVDSSAQEDAKPRLQPGLIRHQIEDRVWYFRPPSPPNDLFGPMRADAVKIINLRSPRIPAPAMAIGVHIADVDRSDFFDITGDGSLCMPDRLSVPSLTMLRLITRQIDGDAIRELKSLPMQTRTDAESTDAGSTAMMDAEAAGVRLAASLAQQWTIEATSDWQRVEMVVNRLRSDFVFDRELTSAGEDPLADFLAVRRGGDHLFATAATVMLQRLGFQARLVTGFYAPRRTSAWSAEQVDIVAADAHVWAEVMVSPEVWIPIEPTPGYEMPSFYRSLSSRFAAAMGAAIPYLAFVIFLAGGLWISRRIWGEWGCRLVWQLSRPLSARRRVVLLVRLLDMRGRFAGEKRPAGVTPRNWVNTTAAVLTGPNHSDLSSAAERFFDLADSAFYGSMVTLPRQWVEDADRVASGLTVGALMKSKRKKVMNR